MSLPLNLPTATSHRKKRRWLIFFILLPILSPIVACALWWVWAVYQPPAFQVTGKILYECYPELCVVNADGSEKTQLTFQSTPEAGHENDETIDSEPSWSPDGKKIIFSRTLRSNATFAGYQYVGLFIMNSDGSHLTVTALVKKPIVATNPSWSHDGKKIVFVNKLSSDHEALASINVDNVDGSGFNTIISSENLDQPRWSPDDARIAFIMTDTSDDAYIPPPPNSWDMDGRSPSYIYIVDANGLNRRRLTEFNSSSPAWSPDGKKIAFTSPSIYGKGGIWIINTDGSDLRQLTDSGVAPVWSPDGQYIAYAYTHINLLCPPIPCRTAGLRIIKSDGSKEIQITKDDIDFSPAWQPIP